MEGENILIDLKHKFEAKTCGSFATITGNSLPEVFLGKGALKICSKNITLWDKSSLVNLLHIFRASRGTSLERYFWITAASLLIPA